MEEHSAEAYLKQLTDRELTVILRYVLENYERSAGETVRAILAVLRERDKDTKPEITPEIRAMAERILN